MKLPAILALFSATLLAPHATADEAQVLSPKGKAYDFPTGTKITREVSFAMKDAKMSIVAAAGKSIEGTMDRTDTLLTTTEILAPGKFRHVEVKKEAGGKVVIAGNEQAVPQPANSLAGVPLVVEGSEGKFTSTLENGTATPEQEKQLPALLARFTAAVAASAKYGDSPHKPGDKWDGELASVSALAGIEQIKGTCTVEFLKTEDFEGVPCAVLKLAVDVTGVPPEASGTGGTIAMKGESVVHRSLADHIDLDGKLEGTMILDIQRSGRKVHTTGSCTATEKVTLKKP